MDTTALFTLSYGMYLISTKDGARDVGCVANSVIQVTSSPATLAVSLNKGNYTHSRIQRAGVFTVSVLAETVDSGVIGAFGFSSGRDTDKFAHIEHTATGAGIAVPRAGVCATLDCRLIDQRDCLTHTIFIAEIVDARRVSEEAPMTYAYYHKVIKGKAPKNAPTYVADEADSAKAYVCDVCGYIFPGAAEAFEALPDSYTCPVCAAPKNRFTLQ
ncbi:MAG: flavin reductase [Firmicutes bacterium]|nr:flavin reductase [Bacillota bacterium]